MKFPHRSEGHKKFNFFVHFSRKGQTKVRSPMNLTRSVSSTEAVSLFEVIQRELPPQPDRDHYTRSLNCDI